MNLRAAPVRFTVVPALLAAAGVYLCMARTQQLDPLWTWLIAINVIVLPLWALDKLQSKRPGGFRVPELTLHLVAAAGGAPMSLVAMSALRHKTRHPHFRRLYLVLVIAWGALGYLSASRQ